MTVFTNSESSNRHKNSILAPRNSFNAKIYTYVSLKLYQLPQNGFGHKSMSFEQATLYCYYKFKLLQIYASKN